MASLRRPSRRPPQSLPGNTDLILRSLREQASRRMDATHGLAAILRDARKGALLRMRSEISCPQTQSDPEGGIPSGSLEVLGRLESVVAWKTDCGYSSQVFPPDVANCFNCFVVGYLFGKSRNRLLRSLRYNL